MRPRTVVIVVLLILTFTLAAQNVPDVQVEVFFWSFHVSHALLLLGTLAVGFLLGLLVGRPWRPRRAKPDKPRRESEQDSDA